MRTHQNPPLNGRCPQLSRHPDQPEVTQRDAVRLSDGTAISLRRWGPERERRIVVSHGNGLAADGFWCFGRDLLAEFEVIAFDLRSHGENAAVPQDAMPWPRYIADIPEIFDGIEAAFGSRETHGAFHSMSSACTLVAQTLTPRPWASLTLFEPPVAAPIAPELVAEFNVIQHGLAQRAAGRRDTFPAPENLARSFGRAPTFAGIAPEAILQLARATLKQQGETWQLSCPPAYEAANFDTAGMLAEHWAALAKITTPVQLILGDLAVHDMPHLAHFGQLMGEAFNFATVTCPGTNHFMQLQEPEFCARQVAAFIKQVSEAPEGVKAAKTNREMLHVTARGSAIEI